MQYCVSDPKSLACFESRLIVICNNPHLHKLTENLTIKDLQLRKVICLDGFVLINSDFAFQVDIRAL